MSKSKKIKCPWCGRKGIGFSKKGFLEPHIQSTKIKCHGVGQTEHTVLWLIDQKSKK